MLEAFKGTNFYVAVLLALTLGLRRGEVLGLRWDDIDFDNKSLTIQQTLVPSKNGLLIKGPKSKNSYRSLLVYDGLLIALRELKEMQVEKRGSLCSSNDNGFVICNDDGSPIHPTVFNRRFKEILAKTDLPKMRFHDLRHSFCSLMIKNNIHAKVASMIMGHSSVGITLDRYSHVDKESMGLAINKLCPVFFNNDNNHTLN